MREGAARDVTVDFALRAVALRLRTDLEPLVVAQLQGRLSGQRRDRGGSLSLHQFGFLTGDGVRWVPGDLEFTWTRDANGAIGSGELSAGRLDLGVIAHTAARLPLGEALRTLLAQANPRGVASDVRAGWDGSLDAPAHYRVSARVAGLSIAAKADAGGNAIGRPGLHNASVEISATENGGQATIAMRDGAVELPGIFEDAVVPLAELDAKLRWRVEPRAGAEPAVQVQLSVARLSNADAQGELQATWKTGAGEGLARGGRYPGVLELDATLTKGVAARTARYLPLGLPPCPATRNRSDLHSDRRWTMAQHFLLSARARTLSFKAIYQAGNNEAYETFCRLRWSDTDGRPQCPRCASERVHHVSTRRRVKCAACHHQFSVTSGKIFARKLSFVDLLAVNRRGISHCLARTAPKS